MPYHRTADGTRFYYEVAGRAGGRCPTFILVHGLCSNLDHWGEVRERLAEHGRVLAVDLRGHGRSDAPSSGYTINGFAADLGALVEAHGGSRPAILFGHSMGSTVAMALAGRSPHLVRAVISVDGSLTHYATATALLADRTYRAFADREHPDGVRALYRNLFPGARDAGLGARIIENAGRTPRHAAIGSLRATLTADVPAMGKHVRQPFLYIAASRGNPRTAAMLQALVPHAEFAQAALSGHFIQLEAPDQVVAMIDRFVSRLE
ncbi:MAG: alpha/beta hydrolase [Chloroflexi bacterium]|nr:MAG: alpha/beta hydrolase [Chloroflexota bacterium]